MHGLVFGFCSDVTPGMFYKYLFIFRTLSASNLAALSDSNLSIKVSLPYKLKYINKFRGFH